MVKKWQAQTDNMFRIYTDGNYDVMNKAKGMIEGAR